MTTTNYTIGSMTHKYTARLEYDDDPMSMFEWPEGVKYERDEIYNAIGWRNQASIWDIAERAIRPNHEHAAFLVRDSNDGPYLADSYSEANMIIFIPSGPEGFTNPREAANDILNEFRLALHGEVYGYMIEDETGQVVDSCWGFIGLEYAEEAMADALNYQQANPKPIMRVA